MARTLPDAATLRHRLATLRRQLRRVTLFRGVSLVLALVFPCALVAGLLDWTCHLPGLIRAVFLTGILSGSGILAYRFLYKPLRERVDDLTLALRIEESYPSLNDSLASTVEFLNQTEARAGESAAMRREAVRRTLGHAAGCEFNRIVDRRGLATATIAAFVAANLVWPLFLVSPALASTAVARLLNPFGGHEWPRQTQIVLEKPTIPAGQHELFIGRNELFEVRGQVTGVIPEQVRVVFQFDRFRPEEHRLDLKKEGDKAGLFSTRIEPGKIQTSFKFQVFAGDNETAHYTVTVLPPPELDLLDGERSPQLQLHFPGYTDLPSPLALPPGTGNIDAIAGTFVTFRAAADRPLKQAWIEFVSEQRLTPLAGFLGPLGATNLPGFLALSAAGQVTWERVQANLDQSRKRISVDFLPRLTGLYILHFEDDNNLRGSRIFELRLRPDPAPIVTMERPSPTRDILSVLPTANVQVQVSADDPQFAVRSVFLRYRIRSAGVPQVAGEPAVAGETRILCLHDPLAVRTRLLPRALGASALLWKSLKIRPPRLDLQQMLSLRNIKHLDDSALKEGDVVVLQACADDYDDITPNKQPGISHEVELRIVSSNSLDLELNDAQDLVQKELQLLREKEREAIRKVLDAEKRLKRGEQLTQEEQAQLVEAEQLQQQIHERVGNDEKGLRSQIARIQETLKQNGLQNSAVRDRMTEVGRELDRLAERELEEVENRLNNARKMADRQAQLAEKAKDAEKQAVLEEQTARKKAEAAALAEEKARQSKTEQERAQLEADARRQKQQAEAALQKAEELRKQAAKDGQESNQPVARQQLTEARKHQEEVEKTINDLLKQMEPWSSAREIKGEAKRLLQEQKQLQAQLEELKDKMQKDGKPIEELTPQEKAELQDLQDRQQRLEKRMNQLAEKMESIAQQREKANDPETARELREARQQADQSDIAGQMKQAQEQIGQNQLNKAKQNQETSVAELEKMVRNLEDRREAELDRLAKKLREAEKKLEQLKEEQEKLAKKVKEAQQNPDAEKREEELKQLSRQQQKLREQTKEMVEQLSRLRADRASQALGKANQEMEKGQKAEDPQETLDRLNEAQRELEQARKKAEEELQREQLIRVAESIQLLKERQEALNNNAAKLQTRVQQAANWERGHKGSLLDLGRSEEGLGTETSDLARKELTGTPVFARMLRRAAEAMTEVNQRVQQMKMDLPDPKNLPDPELTRLQQQATKRLTQVLEAVKEQAQAGKGPAGGGPGGQGGQGDGGEGGNGGAGDSGLPPIAQLKLLKALQLEVNQQTEAFQKKHPNLDKLTDAEKAELQSIRKQQQDIVELLEDFRRPAGEPGDPEEEKK